MTLPLSNTDNVTDIRPALAALLARVREAEAGAAEIGQSAPGKTRRAAQALVALHARHGARLEELGAAAAVGTVAAPSPTGAEALEGGVLPGTLAALQDRLSLAFDRAIKTDGAGSARDEMVAMKADLLAMHAKIGLV